MKLKYSELLKQPLILGMFIPCDLEGNIIELIHEEYYMSCHSMYHNELNRYYEAKKRVLFESFELSVCKDALIHRTTIKPLIIRIHIGKKFSINGKEVFKVEDLLKYGLKIKQIFI